MSRGIIEAQTLPSEQFEFEARTSDPADAQPGEYWIRVDQTSSNPDVIAELRRQDNSGVTTCPIFAEAEESNLGADVTRGPSVVLDGGSVGFIAMTTGSGEVGSPRAVNSSGTEYLSHNGLELNPIPDSVVSRADDDKTTTSSTSNRGIIFNLQNQWDGDFQARISANTTTAGDEDIVISSSSGEVTSKDVSSNSGNDIITLSNISLNANTDYNIYLRSSNSRSIGYNYLPDGSGSFPFTSSDGNITITAGYDDGSSNSAHVYSITQIGNINL